MKGIAEALGDKLKEHDDLITAIDEKASHCLYTMPGACLCQGAHGKKLEERGDLIIAVGKKAGSCACMSSRVSIARQARSLPETQAKADTTRARCLLVDLSA